MLKSLLIVALLSSSLFAQAGSNTTNPDNAPSAAPQPQSAAPTDQAADGLTRMRVDLDHMDGLLNNMSAEIEFLHDQNLQILLRTNAQMWTMLLRDMRQQLAREQQHQVPPNPAPPTAGPPKTKPH